MVQTVPPSSGKMIALLAVAFGALRVVVKALVAFFITIDPLTELAVPRVRLEPATVMVPVKLAALEMVWLLMRPEVMVPEMFRLPVCWAVGDSNAIVPELSLIVMVRPAVGVPVNLK